MESARAVVMEYAKDLPIPIQYLVEPRQNIALARNTAVENAQGDYIVFIDDDEFPTPSWLMTMVNTCAKYDVDGVLGPVKPWFEHEPPKWVVRGKFHERPTYPTGLVIDWRKGRTGNTFLKKGLFTPGQQHFRPEFLTGEDQDFFRRTIEKGHRFVWCNEAVAYEIVPAERCKRSFMLRRALLRGKVSLEHPDMGAPQVLKSAIAIMIYSIALPFLFLIGHHWFMKYLVKTCDHAGRILAFVGSKPTGSTYVSQ
jgi:glycosyltransferase involved in cell wall biosynthesis